ncbi:hypothetical protein ANN_16029 [Periplaneta americana]|uniref:Uncharacterized protein n=1 Tax=Periplaneta americana TaxID=6978 RepID=A0ABQ8SIA2_PERAM|nr:hypothetical protein ANN_16029 [Periplaneta americana]
MAGLCEGGNEPPSFLKAKRLEGRGLDFQHYFEPPFFCHGPKTIFGEHQNVFSDGLGLVDWLVTSRLLVIEIGRRAGSVPLCEWKYKERESKEREKGSRIIRRFG